jgi:hypothetical protein
MLRRYKMFKKSIIVLIVFMFTLVSVSMAFASSAAGGPDGNDRKGKYSYRKVCKACFKAGDVDTATPKLSPADHTMAEWKAIFENKNFKEFGCESHWVALSDKAILDIYSYFWSHASDSPTPAKCQ